MTTAAERARISIAPIIAGLLGAGIALSAVLAPHGLFGITQYDDGVYFGASLRLLSGALPYRDFIFVQPPAIVLLMAPFSLLAHLTGTSVAMAAVRVTTALVAGANAALAALLLRRRGLVAALGAGVALAIFPPAFFADHSLLLEPYLVLAVLIGANLALGAQGDRPSRMLLAGIALGIAGAVKLWAIVPALALLVVLTARDRRLVGRYLLGVALGFACCCLPFFLAAPHAFLHDVFVSQLGRQSRSNRQPLVRLWGIVGLHGLSLHLTYVRHRDLGIVVAAVDGGLLSIGGLLPLLRRRAEAVEVFSLLSALGAVALLYAPVEYFDHYAYFSAAFLALALGCAGQRIVDFLGALLRPARSRPRRALAALLGTLALVAAMLAVVRVVGDERRYDRSLLLHDATLGPAIATAVPPGACAVSDDVALLIEANRFFTAVSGCPDVVDADGTWLAEDPSQPTGVMSPSDAALVALWRSYFSHAQYVVLRAPNSFRIPFTPSLRRTFASEFTRIGGGNIAVYERRALP